MHGYMGYDSYVFTESWSGSAGYLAEMLTKVLKIDESKTSQLWAALVNTEIKYPALPDQELLNILSLIS